MFMCPDRLLASMGKFGEYKKNIPDQQTLAGGELLHSAGLAGSAAEGCANVTRALDDGTAARRFQDMLQVQVGIRAPTFRPTCFRPTFFFQSY